MKTSGKTALICAAGAGAAAAAWSGIGGYFVKFGLMRQSSGGQTTEAMGDNLGHFPEYMVKADREARKWLGSAGTEPVSVISRDGLTLNGVMLDAGDKKWVILVHGYRGEGSEMASYARRYLERGYSVLIPDLRAHGRSEGSIIGMGWLDRLDVLQWIDVVTARRPDAEIVLHGQSMGSAAVLMTSGEKMPCNVRAVVADCGYTGVWEMFGSVLKSWFHIGPFPVLNIANSYFMAHGGYDLRKADACAQVRKSVTPTLFIHGEADQFVPPRMVKKLYDAASCEKDMFTVPGAGHIESQFKNPETYYSRLDSFLGKYVK